MYISRPYAGQRLDKGFSLLEIMVVLVIFSVIAIGSSRLLLNLQRTQRSIEAQGSKLENLQFLIMTMRYDISQVALRTPVVLAESATNQQVSLEVAPFSFGRLGWDNPLQQERSTLAYMTYKLVNGVFLRQIWPFAVYAQGDPSFVQTFTTQVNHLYFRAVINTSANIATPSPKTTGSPSSANAASSASPPPISAVEMIMSLPYYGEIRQLVPVVQAP